MHVLVTCKYEKDRIKSNWDIVFSIISQWGLSVANGNQSFDPVCPKTLCSLSPNPVMLHIKFDQDWPTGFRDIKVWKCGQRRTMTTDGRPLVYYKLTLWAFSSGELKIEKIFWPILTPTAFVELELTLGRNSVSDTIFLVYIEEKSIIFIVWLLWMLTQYFDFQEALNSGRRLHIIKDHSRSFS